MRVAFVGTHRTGKTTLVEAVAARLRGYEVVEEPYRVLEEEGVELGDPPGVEDFEAQLRVSIEELGSTRPDVLFDRAPIDLMAYLRAIDGDVEAWEEEVREAMETIALVVLVPIETPDRIAVGAHEDRRLRARVDVLVRELAEDVPAMVEVTGDVETRVRQVLRAMQEHA